MNSGDAGHESGQATAPRRGAGRQVLEVILATLVVMVPWLVVLDAKEVFTFGKELLVEGAGLLLGVLLVLHSLETGERPRLEGPVLRPLALLALWMTASAAWAPSWSLAFERWFFFAALAAIGLAALLVGRSEASARRLATLAIASAAGAASLALFQAFDLDRFLLTPFDAWLAGSAVSGPWHPGPDLVCGTGWTSSLLAWLGRPASLILPPSENWPIRAYALIGYELHFALYVAVVLPSMVSRVLDRHPDAEDSTSIPDRWATWGPVLLSTCAAWPFAPLLWILVPVASASAWLLLLRRPGRTGRVGHWLALCTCAGALTSTFITSLLAACVFANGILVVAMYRRHQASSSRPAARAAIPQPAARRVIARIFPLLLLAVVAFCAQRVAPAHIVSCPCDFPVPGSAVAHTWALVRLSAVASVLTDVRSLLAGNGLGSFSLDMMEGQRRVLKVLAFASLRVHATKATDPSSNCLDLLTSGGLIGLCLASLAVTGFGRIWTKYTKYHPGRASDATTLGLAASGLAVLSLALLASPLLSPPAAATGVCLGSLGLARLSRSRRDRGVALHRAGPDFSGGRGSRARLSTARRNAARVALAALFVIGFQSFLHRYLAQHFWLHGWLAFRQERYAEAVSSYTQALRYTPTRGEIHFDLGRALLDSGATTAARCEFRRSLETVVDPAAYVNIALCIVKDATRAEAATRGVLRDRARALLHRALELNPQCEVARKNLDTLGDK